MKLLPLPTNDKEADKIRAMGIYPIADDLIRHMEVMHTATRALTHDDIKDILTAGEYVLRKPMAYHMSGDNADLLCAMAMMNHIAKIKPELTHLFVQDRGWHTGATRYHETHRSWMPRPGKNQGDLDMCEKVLEKLRGHFKYVKDPRLSKGLLAICHERENGEREGRFGLLIDNCSMQDKLTCERFAHLLRLSDTSAMKIIPYVSPEGEADGKIVVWLPDKLTLAAVGVEYDGPGRLC